MPETTRPILGPSVKSRLDPFGPLPTLDHPNIASDFGLHESEGVRFLAMELVPGPSEMRFDRDGRTLVLATETSEFDVWLLSLEP